MLIFYATVWTDYEYGRLLACTGDVEGAKHQFELVLSGKHLEVNAAGKKGKYSLEVGLHIVFSSLLHTPTIEADMYFGRIVIPEHATHQDECGSRSLAAKQKALRCTSISYQSKSYSLSQRSVVYHGELPPIFELSFA